MEPLLRLPPHAEFIELVRAADADAAYRLPLLEQAAPVLYEGAAVASEQGEILADRFERWRYQILNNREGRLSSNDRHLVQALDLAAGAIRRGRLWPPRNPRSVLEPSPLDDARVESCLDPNRPLEEVASWAAEETSRRFASPALATRRRMTLYAPLYLSNFCINYCHYCAFRYPHALEREHLTLEQTLSQADILRQRGFRHLLVVAGDFPRLTSTDYFVEVIRALTDRGFSVAVEVAPQTTLSYARMVRAGACGVTLYQETYQEDLYTRFHQHGPKLWFDWRLEGPERAAEAGMSRLGLGILLGLADPRSDIRALIRHGRYLLERFPDVRLAFSLPRIHEAPDGFEPPYQIDDDTFLRLCCALRLAFPSADLLLSTREAPALRDRLASICITQMSAGSCTAPGGYDAPQADPRQRQQFPVVDDRSAAEVAETLTQAGFDVRWELP